jgi:hypothetical protein
MIVDQTQFPRELEDSFDSCSYIEEYIPDEYFLHKICHTLQKIIQITPKKPKKKPLKKTLPTTPLHQNMFGQSPT